MGDEDRIGAVVGRWQLGVGRALDRRSTLHPATLLGGDGTEKRLVEIHHLGDDVDPTGVVAELRQASRITDPGLTTIVDVGATHHEGRPVLYLATANWHERLGDRGLDEAELVALARSVASGLATLHRSSLVHGALHRGAVRRGSGSWQLGPAGLAPLLETEIAPYRPPGLHVVEPAAPPADLWSLGVILHEQSTGRLLRPGEVPLLPDLPKLEPIVGELLQAEPADRPTAEELLGRLAALDHEPVAAPGAVASTWAPPGGQPAPPPSASPTPEPVPHRSPWTVLGVALASVLTAAAIVGGVVVLTGDRDAPSAPAARADDRGADPGPAPTDPDEAGTTGDVPDEDAEADPIADEAGLGPVGFGQLAVGDCIDVDLTIGDPTAGTRVACAEDYVAEVVGMVDHRAAEEGTYPGRAELLGEARTTCEAEFERYVGGPELLTSLFLLTAVPTFGEWDRDDRRTTVCLAHSFDGTALAGGLAGRYGSYELIEGSAAPISKLFGARCFEIDGVVDGIGRRQEVTIVGCENLHRHETLSVENLPLDGEELASETLTPAIATKLANEAAAVCTEVWDTFTTVEGAPEPVVDAIVPNVLDWQLGDRLMTCTATWSEPVLGSVVIRNLPPLDGDEDGG